MENDFLTIKPSENDYVKLYDYTGIKRSELFIPEGIELIPNGVTNKLTSKVIHFPASLKEIYFCGCKTIEKAIFEEGIEQIWVNSFCHCRNLKSIILPKSLKKIYPGAFEDTNLSETVIIPENVVEIGPNAFSFSEIKELIIESENITIFNGAFSDCRYLQSVEFTPGVKTIGLFDFTNCENLKKITIPYTVTNISNNNIERNEQVKIYMDANTLDVLKKTSPTFVDSCSKKIEIMAPTIDSVIYHNKSKKVNVNDLLNDFSISEINQILKEMDKEK